MGILLQTLQVIIFFSFSTSSYSNETCNWNLICPSFDKRPATLINDQLEVAIKKGALAQFVSHVEGLNSNNLYYYKNQHSKASLLEWVSHSGVWGGPRDKFKKMRWLIDHGAQITDEVMINTAQSSDKDGDCEDIFSYLVSNGGNIKPSRIVFSRSLIERAAEAGNCSVIQSLLAINDAFGMREMQKALFHCKKPEALELLITVGGADVTMRDFYKNTILHALTDTVLIKVISKHTSVAMVNSPNDEGNTPLHNALIKGISSQSLLLLLKHPLINIEIKNNEKKLHMILH